MPPAEAGEAPWERVKEEYALEYGTDTLECHSDGVGAGSKVLVVDDVLATGGTAKRPGCWLGSWGGSDRMVDSCWRSRF